MNSNGCLHISKLFSQTGVFSKVLDIDQTWCFEGILWWPQLVGVNLKI